MYEQLRSFVIDRMFFKNGIDQRRWRRHFQRVFRKAALMSLANRAVAEHEPVIEPLDDVLSYSNLQAYGMITLQALPGGHLFRVVMSPVVLDAWITLQGIPYRKGCSCATVTLVLDLVVAAVLSNRRGSTLSVICMHADGDLLAALRTLPLINGAPVAGNAGQKVRLAVAFCPTCKSDLRHGMPHSQGVACLALRLLWVHLQC